MKGILTVPTVYLWNEQIVCPHMLEHTHPFNTHVLMYTCMGGCTGGMGSAGQMPAGKPMVILSLRHWELHGSVHKVAANIKECRDCSRTVTKGSCNPEVCDMHFLGTEKNSRWHLNS